VGSRNYHPQELATHAAFAAMPATVWAWYLSRYRTCAQAQPNAAHLALVEAARVLGERFLLVTQNVDGLHRRAGSPEEQLFEIHGNIAYARCVQGCTGLLPLAPLLEHFPDEVAPQELPRSFHCGNCWAPLRPHVLWFDEYYDEPLFRLDTTRAAARSAALLVVIGTTGATNLPLQVGELAVRADAPLVVINPEPNPFSELVKHVSAGIFLQGRAGEWVPELVAALRPLAEAPASRRP
jgi:NAD-dependent deacetylase